MSLDPMQNAAQVIGAACKAQVPPCEAKETKNIEDIFSELKAEKTKDETSEQSLNKNSLINLVEKFFGAKDDGKVSDFEANSYAKGEAQIQEEVAKRMPKSWTMEQQYINGKPINMQEEKRAEIEKEVREEYSKEHPEYARSYNDCKQAEEKFEAYKQEQLAKWEEEHPFDNLRMDLSYPNSYYQEKQEFLTELTSQYAQDNPDFEKVLDAKTQYIHDDIIPSGEVILL